MEGRRLKLLIPALVLSSCSVAPSPFSVPVPPQAFALPIVIEVMEPFDAVVLPMRGSHSQVAAGLERVRGFLRDTGRAPVGPAFGHYFSDLDRVSEALLQWEVGFPVGPGAPVKPPFESRSYARATVARAFVRGPFVETGRLWPVFAKSCVAAGFQPVGAAMVIWRGDEARAGALGPKTEFRVPVRRASPLAAILRQLVSIWSAFLFVLFLLLYLRQEHRRRFTAWGGGLWALLASVCALFYMVPPLDELHYLYGAGWIGRLSHGADSTSILALPLFMHVWYRGESGRLRWRWAFRLSLCAMYSLAAAYATFLLLRLFPPEWQARLDLVVAGLVLAIAAFGFALDLASRDEALPDERRARRWILTVTAAAALLALLRTLMSLGEGALILLQLAPVGFLLQTAYFRERVLFFDILVKRGLFALIMLLVLTGYFLLVPTWLWSERLGWWGGWVFPISLAPLVAVSPWAYAGLSSVVDRRWLGRRHSPREAYRLFVGALGTAGSTEGLRLLAEEWLAGEFRAPVRVELGQVSTVTTTGEDVPLVSHARCRGRVTIDARASRRPFLSEDRALLELLAEGLTLCLENLELREKRDQHELSASRAELRALRAQINPHFLFNALNSIAALIAKEPERAEATVEGLSELFRYTLRRSEREWVRLDEEMAFLRCYLDLERTRFGPRLEVDTRVDPAAREAWVPAMILQTLVENAVKHGVSRVRGMGTLAVAVSRREERLQVEVRDNGPGPRGEGGEDPGHGLRNVRERLRGHFGGAASVTLSRAQEEMETVAILELPFVAVPPPEGGQA